MLAVVPVRDGVLPAGALEAVAECGGRVVLAGSGLERADTAGFAIDTTRYALGDFAPARWASALAALIDDEDRIVVLPASPDGRDLAPRLAHATGRPLHAGAVEIGDDLVRVARAGGLELHDVAVEGPVVVTLQPGVRGLDAPTPGASQGLVRDVPARTPPLPRTQATGGGLDAVMVEVAAPDVTTMDLAEAPRIVGGGAGLDGPARLDRLRDVAAALGASLGATRVVTDRGWVDHARQIGTTGVVVGPHLYVAFGISGAVQHTAGLGDPDHIVSVNTDPHCPMMQMADLAVVSDANAVVDELARSFGLGG